MKFSFRSLIKGFLLALAGAGALLALPALAQVDLGALKAFGEAAGFSTGPSVTLIIARLIRTALSFVGIVVVIMVVYGGFLYMTSGGNATRLEKAKKILIQAVIGLLIVLSSFVIVQFIISRMVEATGGGVSSSQSGPGDYPDGTTLTSFHLSSVNTQCAAALNNLQLQLVFSKDVNPATVSAALGIKKQGGGPVEGTFVTSGSLVTFTPSTSCPAPNPQAKCFDPNAQSATYNLVVNAGVLKSSSGATLKCTTEFPCSFTFTTGTGVDVAAPTLFMSAPGDGQSVAAGTIQMLQAKTQDDTGVSSVDFYAVNDDSPLFTSGLNLSTAGTIVGGNQNNAFSTDPQLQWNTAGYTINKSYPLWARALDCAGNATVSTKISAMVRGPNCDNDVQDVDLGETGVDCGGDPVSEFYCGKCDEQTCTQNNECASGLCENGVCVSKPRIDQVSPGDGKSGNLVTIFGDGFEDVGGTVTFLGGASVSTSAYACNGNVSWKKKQIVVQVPEGAQDGPIEVATVGAKKKTDRTDDAFGPLSSDFDINAVARPGLCLVDPGTAKPGAQVSFFGLGFGAVQGASSLYFKDVVSPSIVSWADKLVKGAVPNMNAAPITTQIFSGTYQCVDDKLQQIGKTCQQDEECGEGNTCAKKWCTETLAYCSDDVSCGVQGGKCRSVRVGSNGLNFVVGSSAGDTEKPVITYLDSGWSSCNGGANNGKHCGTKADCGDGECKGAPNWGPSDQYVTIFGTGFGTAKGQVFFTNAAGQTALAKTNFPEICGDDFWKDTSVTVKVPDSLQAGGAVDPGNYQVTVKKGPVSSNGVDFVVVKDQPGPAICHIDPLSGPVTTTKVQVFGENLGNEKGAIAFYDKQNADYLFWNSTQVTDAVVPKEAKTGPLAAVSKVGYRSNPVSFTVGSCQENVSCPANTQCCGDGSCKKSCNFIPPVANFAYRVSTGLIPKAPQILPLCNDNVKSPSPWESWPDSKTVCRNSVVTATFDLMMNQDSLKSHVAVEQCTDLQADGCKAWQAAEGNMVTSETTFNWTPNVLFAAATRYRVTVAGGEGGVQSHASVGGAFMEEDYSWEFLTAPGDQVCDVGGVNVTPYTFTAVEDEQQVSYLSQLVASGYQCVTISCQGQNISWSSNKPVAEVQQPSVGVGQCKEQVIAHEETQGDPAKIKATVLNADQQPFDTGDLFINFTDPTVSSFFPQCATACVNAKPWARFGAKMNPGSFAQGVLLYECEDAICGPGKIKDAGLLKSVSYVDDTRTLFVELSGKMKPDKWYRVVLKGTILKSISGVFLKDSGSNFGSDQNKFFPSDFSWRFKTKVSDVSCGVDSVSVIPKTTILKTIGAREQYHATTYGAPDDCDASGQALQDTGYTWKTWTAADLQPELFTPAQGGTSQDVAFMLKNGAISLSNKMPLWCSPVCLNTGSQINAKKALCGDGVVNGPGKIPSEECDGGAWCSSSCLLIGTNACAAGVAASCCGNGAVDPGEQCDDGGHIPGDGCSDVCLNEGSASIGSVCGDGVIDFAPGTGGEDCDDGNTKDGDGCSSKCLFEGSIAKVADFSVCGNGGNPEKGEDCDDGNNINGDGCSASCLNEGTAQCALVCSDTQASCQTKLDCAVGAVCAPAKTPCCGNGGNPEKGEDCDDGNAKSGDGCKSSCLKEGSSVNYVVPSFCGDGKKETGEECEADGNLIGQAFKIVGYGVAQVGSKAAKEVSPEGYAVSTITATAEGIPGTATLQVECSCKTDASCGDTSLYACGTSGCCYPRPDVTVFEPSGNGPGGQGFCRNTAVRVKFNQQMDPVSFGALDADGNGSIDQNELANIRLELVSNNGNDSENNEKNCPTDYLFAQANSSQESVLARLWHWVERTVQGFFGHEAQAGDPKKCVAPISYQAVNANDGQWVYLTLNAPLEKNSTYRIRVVGDTDPSDTKTQGVKSVDGADACFGPGCATGYKSATFKTGNEVCLLDAVTIEDVEKIGAAPYEPPSPAFFTKLNEEHRFLSQAQTYRAGLGTYEPIVPTNIYGWSWEWGSSVADDKTKPEDIVDLTSQKNPPDPGMEGRLAAVGHNGSEHVLASAVVNKDTLNNPTTIGTEKGTVAGTLEVTALTCENPWPEPDPLTGWKPYLEKTDPAKPSNFGFYYCRDRGDQGTGDDLPPLDPPVDVTSIAVGGLLQELFFKVQGTPDAIGVRVFQNPNYLSPAAWFKSQKFTGAFGPIQMDGYEGIQSGNTAYVAAANEHGVVLYPNIYVISYNPSAGSDARAIFEEILKNWRFNANTNEVSNVNLCRIGNKYIKDDSENYVACSWDGDCVEALVDGQCTVSHLKEEALALCPLAPEKKALCDSDKAKIQRDMKRLTDITQQVTTLDAYGGKNRHCSVTKTQSCSVNEQCPGTEKCVAGYPTIKQGTFVPAMSVSKWGSWNASFSNELGSAVPIDPLNVFWRSCSTLGPKYDPATCFNSMEGKFVCPNQSHVYAYQNKGGEAYTLFTQLEFIGAPWVFDIDPFENDAATIVAEYPAGANVPGQMKKGFAPAPVFCSDQKVWGTSTSCGDGVVGAQEICEPGQIQSAPCTVSVNGQLKNGFINVGCRSDVTKPKACQEYQTADEAKIAGAVCVPNQCGNGILETGEQCDDGALNGTYGHCGKSCTFAGSFVCGDGYLAGGEQCDCGTLINHAAVVADPTSWAAKNKNQNQICFQANGQYSPLPNGSCSFDCKIPGPSCGDKLVNGAEQCDGTMETYAGKLCPDGKTTCETNNDCPGNGVCGDPGHIACPASSHVCVGGNKAGQSCTQNQQCGAGTCSTFSYPLTRTRLCTNACTWPGWSVCLGGDQICGNGTKEGTEECDDGNQNDNDSCTHTCKKNICGDSYKFDGVEACDNGGQNVLPDSQNPCTAQYGGSCNYCNTLCQYKTFSGSYCGDGVINGTEFCDGSAIPYSCLKVSGSDRSRAKSCPATDALAKGPCDQGFTCQLTGVCNGGTQNGQPCTLKPPAKTVAQYTASSNQAACAGGGVCVAPTCTKDCTAACPFTLQTTSVLVQSELPDAQPQESVDLYSYFNKEKNSPDSASLFLPACSVGTRISADVDDANVHEPDVDVVFVTDLSGSMMDAPNGGGAVVPNRRIDIVAESTAEAIDTLFNAYAGSEGKLRIGLVSFGQKDDPATPVNEEITAQLNSGLLENSGANKQLLKSIALGYPAKVDGWTPTPAGIKKAIEVLSTEPDSHVKVVVLLSDGDPTYALDQKSCGDKKNISVTTEAGQKTLSGSHYCVAEARYGPPGGPSMIKGHSEIFFYSAAIATSNDLRAQMEHMSSMGCAGNDMSSIDDCQDGLYAFDADTKEEIKQMYDQIMTSILSATTTITASKNGSVKSATGLTPVGNNVTIPVPDTFQCQSQPFTMPMKTNFYGTGTMKFSNFSFTYCPLP
ncbi:VWA domain-containing protein [Candidatus Uhrbacteria bacterium]|nr:VWA domain-containing protein [Candidatus Uhrbacteria bacterium]